MTSASLSRSTYRWGRREIEKERERERERKRERDREIEGKR